jgi:nicotinate-nucleotide adenylyltransferase
MLGLVFLMVIIIGFILISLYYDTNHIKNEVVYIGCFNPLHIGHKAILEELAENYDWVYMCVTPMGLAEEDSVERIENIRMRLTDSGIINISIINIEDDILPPFHVIRILEKLKTECENCNYILVMGADEFLNIKNMKDYKQILKDYGVLVFSRGEINVMEIENFKNNLLNECSDYKIEINETVIPNVSSSDLREMVKDGRKNIKKLLM